MFEIVDSISNLFGRFQERISNNIVVGAAEKLGQKLEFQSLFPDVA